MYSELQLNQSSRLHISITTESGLPSPPPATPKESIEEEDIDNQFVRDSDPRPADVDQLPYQTTMMTRPAYQIICGNDFARHLQSSVVKHFFSFVKSPCLSGEVFPRAFCFSQNKLTKDEITNFFVLLFRWEIFAMMDDWNIPNMCLGGAGTHYPRPPGRHTNNTPFPKKLLDDSLMYLKPSDRQCVWFDVYDVLGYLQQKGIMVAVCGHPSSYGQPIYTSIQLSMVNYLLIDEIYLIECKPFFFFFFFWWS